MFEIFSYWIFIWFILYYMKLTEYNPLLLLIIGYIITFGELLYLIFKKSSKYNIIKFVIINTILKIIPIIMLINTTIRFKDFIMSLYIILIYMITMAIMNINPYKFYKTMLNTYINNDNKYKSIFSKTYDYIYLLIINR